MLMALLFSGGFLSNLLPTDPVLKPEARAVFDTDLPSGAVYTGPPRVDFPVIPLQVWGLRYALDVVISTTNPAWDMHEYARIDLPQGPLWIAKDATAEKVQIIVAPVDQISTWVPEIPVQRIQGPVTATQSLSGKWSTFHFAYQNPLGQPVDVTVTGKIPTKANPHRNGNTMGHSRNNLAALLDLYLFGPAKKVEMTIDGEAQKIKRVGGLVPMKFLLAQVQGGLAIAEADQLAQEGGGLQLERPGGAELSWPTHSIEHWVEDQGWLSSDNGITKLSYRYVNGELVEAQVLQAGDPTPVTHIRFSPALPDVRRPFTGEIHSQFVVDINGQKAHGIGEVVSSWRDATTFILDVRPTAPHWFADRPLQTTLLYGPDRVHLSTIRVPMVSE